MRPRIGYVKARPATELRQRKPKRITNLKGEALPVSTEEEWREYVRFQRSKGVLF